MIDLSIIIPIYNESDNIPLLYERLMKVLIDLKVGYEIVFINDGSHDDSIFLIKSLAEQNPCVRYVDFSRNFGHQIAVTAGVECCKGERVVIIDADLQDPPELIQEMYMKMNEGFDVVYAQRISREGETLLKKLTSKIFYRLMSRLTKFDIPIDTGDFRIVSRRVVEVLKKMPEKNKYVRGQIAWAGFKQSCVQFERAPRNAGETGYGYWKLLKLALDGITSFSDFPLKFATGAGFVATGIAFLLILYTLHSRIILQDFEKGWASEMISILFLGGIQLIGIGIIGEYIARISTDVRNRPLYVVKETNIESEQKPEVIKD